MGHTQRPVSRLNHLNSFPSHIIRLMRPVDTATKTTTAAFITHIAACASSTHTILPTLHNRHARSRSSSRGCCSHHSLYPKPSCSSHQSSFPHPN
ncbi:hypothetical protein HanRHA438_Chr08g0330611 [Helianthus annuus]|nr:hypothetical protein HanRHA438_Chr08g0330611 [Helianthus annuus]